MRGLNGRLDVILESLLIFIEGLKFAVTFTNEDAFTYVGESKRCWKSRRAEHKPGTNGNIGSAVKQHVETTGHDIHPNYASILETGVKTKNERLLLESLH